MEERTAGIMKDNGTVLKKYVMKREISPGECVVCMGLPPRPL